MAARSSPSSSPAVEASTPSPPSPSSPRPGRTPLRRWSRRLSEDPPAGAGRTRVGSHERLPIVEGWQAASCPPDAHTDAGALTELDGVGARVPGTAAAALSAAGRWRPGEEHDFDLEDWW